ncbi:retrovirus-related pol polyprotein from transposon, partial [Lasius niger]
MRTQELLRDVDEVTQEDQNKALARTMPFIKVMVGKLPVKTLVDTGAQISAITKALYDNMTNEGVEMRIIPIKKFLLTGAFSDRGQPIAHRKQINFRTGEEEYTHELYVVRNLAYEMILGIDFLSERKAILQCGKEFTVEFLEKNEQSAELNAIAIEEADTILRRILNDNADLFIDEIGCVEHYEHEIVINNEKPFKGKTYPVPEKVTVWTENGWCVVHTRDAASYRPGLKFGIYVDASKYGLGARLYQYKENRPEERFTVAYASRSLKGAKLNYTVTDIECLALVWALRKWHATLLGRHVKVHSDHRALKFLTACADDSARIARWTAFLHEFDLEICHMPGRENVIADTLSRNNVKNGYAKKEGNTKRIAAIIPIVNDEDETKQWIEMIIDAQREDEQLQREIAEEPETLPSREGLVRVTLHKGERIVIPEAIKWQLVDRIHKYLLHFGTDK